MATINDWTYEKTVAYPQIIKIKFVTQAGADASVELTSTSWTENNAYYTTFAYYDEEGKLQTQDVEFRRNTFTRSTIAAVNGAYVKWNLEKGLGLPPGDANRSSETVRQYAITSSGPRLVSEVTREYISKVEFAGSLNISDYTGVTPSVDLMLASITENRYDEIDVVVGWVGDSQITRTYTKQATTRYQAMGLTQEGSQSASKQIELDKGDGVIINAVIVAMQELMCDGTEIRTAIGRAQYPTRPSATELMQDYITDPYYNDPLLDDLGSGTFYDSAGLSPDSFVELQFDPSSGEYAPQTDYYSMPYAPDSLIAPDGSIIDSGAEQAARAYGEMLTALKVGYSSGFNITTSADRLPSLPFAPVFVAIQGLSVSFRLNGTSWAFDSSGIVASSDLLLCGVAGATGDPVTSWVRMPVSASNLPVLEEPDVNEDPEPASTITAPTGFDATEPGTVFNSLPDNNTDVPASSQTVDAVIAPYVLNEPLMGRTRTRVLMIEQQYLVSSSETITATSRTGVVFVETVPLSVPAAVVAVAGLVPAVAPSATVRPAAGSIAVAAVVPVVGSAVGSFVAPPAATVAVEAKVPAVKTADSVRPAAADIAVAAVAPTTAS